jgi:hypothetical protein
VTVLVGAASLVLQETAKPTVDRITTVAIRTISIFFMVNEDLPNK